MENIVFDVISWFGLTLCIGAFFIKEVFWLRLTTLAGCSLLFIYYTHIAIPQGVISNLLVLLINAFYLLKFAKTRKTEKTAQQETSPELPAVKLAPQPE